MENNEVIKKALEAASAKTGKSVETFLKEKGYDSPELTEAEMSRARKVTPKETETFRQAIEEKTGVERKRTGPIWPIEPEQIAEWAATDARLAKEREAFLKSIDSPEHLAKVRASAAEAASKIVTRHVSYSVKKKEDAREEKAEAKKVKAAEPKKESTRQTRLGQTKLIDELLKAGKNEKEVFDTVREKIPSYPADKLPKLIKLRQYHIKK